ncbi:hypothetical protein [Deinococcus sp.]|uniref:hypothetical protein n=1 Tax=Deinococcus sp. TaxID=47478 RepID=UPI0025BBFFF5|nr:hypothetical protein [Deinococcus sp.]
MFRFRVPAAVPVSARALLLPVLLLAPLLSGCRYNLVPLIPKAAYSDLQLPVKISQAELTREGDTLVLHAELHGHIDPGYLTVTWFDNSSKLGSDSLYLDADLREATFRLPAPNRGAYRAALSFGGNVLRQVELYEVKP